MLKKNGNISCLFTRKDKKLNIQTKKGKEFQKTNNYLSALFLWNKTNQKNEFFSLLCVCCCFKKKQETKQQ